jgi:hypothetical protein
MFEEFRFVVVALVNVALDEVRLVFEIFVADRLVDVELVIVPLATSIAGKDKLVIERFVIVADVRVAFVPTRLVVFVVEALDVEARIVAS